MDTLKNRMGNCLWSVVVALIVLPISTTALAQGTDGSSLVMNEPTLEEVREATNKYKDINVALAEGYIEDPMKVCEMAIMMGRPAEEGGMGIHYFRPDLLGITATEPRVDGVGTHTDFLQPAVLLYEPQADGSLELIAVENLVFVKAWHAAGNEGLPTFQGVEFDHMVDDPLTELDEAHMFEEHYDRHVWVHRENPNGVFTPFNPNVSCKNHKMME
ncbi:hypothetical protein [Halalkalibaculum roseum]|nr:hypothetical protein [Halalkalibaculum roseum]